MNGHIAERDWKLWRTLHETLLERFCVRVLDRAAAFAGGSGSAHIRYLDLFDFLGERNAEMARVFNDQRRSNAYRQIAEAVAAGIVTWEELERFSDETRNRVELLIGPR